MYALILTFSVREPLLAPSVEVLTEAISRTPLANGTVEHVYAARASDRFGVVVYLTVARSADALGAGLRAGWGAATAISTIDLTHCRLLRPGG